MLEVVHIRLRCGANAAALHHFLLGKLAPLQEFGLLLLSHKLGMFLPCHLLLFRSWLLVLVLLLSGEGRLVDLKPDAGWFKLAFVEDGPDVRTSLGGSGAITAATSVHGNVMCDLNAAMVSSKLFVDVHRRTASIVVTAATSHPEKVVCRHEVLVLSAAAHCVGGFIAQARLDGVPKVRVVLVLGRDNTASTTVTTSTEVIFHSNINQRQRWHSCLIRVRVLLPRGWQSVVEIHHVSQKLVILSAQLLHWKQRLVIFFIDIELLADYVVQLDFIHRIFRTDIAVKNDHICEIVNT